MSDKTPTKRLRDGLTAAGVEYTEEDTSTYKWTYWGDWSFAEPLDAKPHTLGARCELLLTPATPEQAIAATVGQQVTGSTSDGYHTFDELYHHRAVLFSVIVHDHAELAWKSKRHHDGTMFDGMFIVGIDTPDGQATYHYYIDTYWDMFGCRELESAPEWDGHTPDEAIERIGRIATAGAGTVDKAAERIEALAGFTREYLHRYGTLMSMVGEDVTEEVMAMEKVINEVSGRQVVS